MTVEEVRAPSLGPTGTRWLGYGLALVGTPVGVVAAIGPAGPGSQLLATAAIAIALVVLALAASSPASFEVKSTRSPTRVINFLLLLPAASLMVAGFTSPLLNPQIVFLTGVAGSAIAVLVGLWVPRAQPAANSTFLYLFLVLYGAGFGVGAPALVNRCFDRSPGQIYQATVEGRRITSGKGGLHYSLKLGPWGPRTGSSYLPVTRAAYDAARPGDSACVSLHPGALGMAWYVAAPC
ncbi:MAG TPA: hypothetical protein VGI30_12115 [Caulobacteraceae bacterium]|jgi:hypothetical protein